MAWKLDPDPVVVGAARRMRHGVKEETPGDPRSAQPALNRSSFRNLGPPVRTRIWGPEDLGCPPFQYGTVDEEWPDASASFLGLLNNSGARRAVVA